MAFRQCKECMTSTLGIVSVYFEANKERVSDSPT